MRTRAASPLVLLAGVAVAAWGAALAADEAAPSAKPGAKVVATKMFRASTLEGMKVRNLQSENVGSISDLVIDVEQGKVAYAAVSVGGFLGVGDKLFAIPFSAFTVHQEPNDSYVVLDISKEKLKAAPGFSKDHWPNVADATWREEIDRYYTQKKLDQAARVKTK